MNLPGIHHWRGTITENSERLAVGELVGLVDGDRGDGVIPTLTNDHDVVANRRIPVIR